MNEELSYLLCSSCFYFSFLFIQKAHLPFLVLCSFNLSSQKFIFNTNSICSILYALPINSQLEDYHQRQWLSLTSQQLKKKHFLLFKSSFLKVQYFLFPFLLPFHDINQPQFLFHVNISELFFILSPLTILADFSSLRHSSFKVIF